MGMLAIRRSGSLFMSGPFCHGIDGDRTGFRMAPRRNHRHLPCRGARERASCEERGLPELPYLCFAIGVHDLQFIKKFQHLLLFDNTVEWDLQYVT